MTTLAILIVRTCVIFKFDQVCIYALINFVVSGSIGQMGRSQSWTTETDVSWQ